MNSSCIKHTHNICAALFAASFETCLLVVSTCVASPPKVVSGSTDGTITVTDLTTGERTMTLRGHEGIVLAVAFDRSKIMSASDDGTLRTWVWAARGPKQVRVLYQ